MNRRDTPSYSKCLVHYLLFLFWKTNTYYVSLIGGLQESERAKGLVTTDCVGRFWPLEKRKERQEKSTSFCGKRLQIVRLESGLGY